MSAVAANRRAHAAFSTRAHAAAAPAPEVPSAAATSESNILSTISSQPDPWRASHRSRLWTNFDLWITAVSGGGATIALDDRRPLPPERPVRTSPRVLPWPPREPPSWVPLQRRNRLPRRPLLLPRRLPLRKVRPRRPLPRLRHLRSPARRARRRPTRLRASSCRRRGSSSSAIRRPRRGSSLLPPRRFLFSDLGPLGLGSSARARSSAVGLTSPRPPRPLVLRFIRLVTSSATAPRGLFRDRLLGLGYLYRGFGIFGSGSSSASVSSDGSSGSAASSWPSACGPSSSADSSAAATSSATASASA